MRKPELLIPAGSLEVLKTAVNYGADAVYIGGDVFSLRAKAKNFTKEEMIEGIAYAHSKRSDRTFPKTWRSKASFTVRCAYLIQEDVFYQTTLPEGMQTEANAHIPADGNMRSTKRRDPVNSFPSMRMTEELTYSIPKTSA